MNEITLANMICGIVCIALSIKRFCEGRDVFGVMYLICAVLNTGAFLKAIM